MKPEEIPNEVTSFLLKAVNPELGKEFERLSKELEKLQLALSLEAGKIPADLIEGMVPGFKKKKGKLVLNDRGKLSVQYPEKDTADSLRERAKFLGIDTKGLRKTQIREKILEVEKTLVVDGEETDMVSVKRL